MTARLPQRLPACRWGQLASRPVCVGDARARAPTHGVVSTPTPRLRRASPRPLGASRTDPGRHLPPQGDLCGGEAARGAGGPGLKWSGQRLLPPDAPSSLTTGRFLGSEFTVWPSEGPAGFGTAASWGKAQQWAFTQPASPLRSLPPAFCGSRNLCPVGAGWQSLCWGGSCARWRESPGAPGSLRRPPSIHPHTLLPALRLCQPCLGK